jgi:hypothetical protein
MADDKKIDEILRQAKAPLSRPPAPTAEKGPKSPPSNIDPNASTLGKIAREVRTGEQTLDKVSNFWTGVKNGWRWFKNTRPVRWPTKLYMAAWHATDAKKRTNPVTRGASRVGRFFLCLFTAATVANAAGYIVPDTATGGKLIDDVASGLNYVSFELAYDSARLASHGGARKEVVCLNKYTEIDHESGVYSANGNEAGKPQDGKHSLYFLTKSSLVHNFYSAAHGRSFVFDPNLVVAPIVNGDTHAYEVETYGWRWKSPIRRLQGYPQLLSVKRLPENSALCFDGAQPRALQTQTPPKPQP